MNNSIKELGMSLGERLKQHRLGMNWTQRDLQQASGVNYMQISHFESDRRMPTIQNAIKLCKALGCSMDWLTRGIRCGEE